MVALYGNLVVAGVAVALFVATLRLGRKGTEKGVEPPRTLPARPVTDPPH